MANIPVYEREVNSLETGSPVQVPMSSPLGEALSQFGQSISSLAQHLDDQQKQKQDFDTQTKYAELQGKLAEEYDAQKETMPVDGGNFAGDFMDKTYEPLTNQFLAGLPPDVAKRYEARIATDRATTHITAATAQRDANYGYYREKVSQFQDHQLGLIGRDPEAVASADSAWNDYLKAANLPPLEKMKAQDAWEAKRATALSHTMSADDALVQSGNGTPAQNESYLYGKLERGVRGAENGTQDPSLISPKGAVGLMQVMPDTAYEIAGKLGDQGMLATKGDRAKITELLKDPTVNGIYGNYYLTQQLKDFHGDVEAALVAYNAGPGNAQKWLAAGRDYSVLPKPQETQPYTQKILTSMSVPAGTLINGQGPATNTPAKDPPKFQWSTGEKDKFADVTATDSRLVGVNPSLPAKAAKVWQALGLPAIRITSGHRDEAQNASAGGADHSQHMTKDGALDIYWGDYTLEQKKAIVQGLSAAGVTGIGVYDNIVHIDLGDRRAWGPDYHRGSVPKWAESLIQAHEANSNTPLPTSQGPDGVLPAKSAIVNPYLKSLPYSEQQRLYADSAKAAGQAVVQRKGTFELGIETGDIHDPNVILNDRVLPDGDKATLLAKLRSTNKEYFDTLNAVTRVKNGDHFNSFDTNDKSAAALVLKSMGGAEGLLTGDAQTSANLAYVVSHTGIVPKQAADTLAQMVTSTDVNQMATGLSIVGQMHAANPRVFDNAENAPILRDQAAAFNHLTQDRGMSSAAAAKMLAEAQNPDNARKVEELKPLVADFAKTLRVSDLTDSFRTGWGWWSSTPGAGVTPMQEAALMMDYKEIATEQFYKFNGNTNAARGAAIAEVQRLYGPTMVSGTPQLMKFPPEQFYPAIGGNHDYVTEAARTGAQRDLEAQGKAPVNHFVNERFFKNSPTTPAPDTTTQETVLRPNNSPDVGKVMLFATRQTADDIEHGRPPRYRLLYTSKENGQDIWQEALDHPFQVPADTIRTKQAQAAETSAVDRSNKLAAAAVEHNNEAARLQAELQRLRDHVKGTGDLTTPAQRLAPFKNLFQGLTGGAPSPAPAPPASVPAQNVPPTILNQAGNPAGKMGADPRAVPRVDKNGNPLYPVGR